MSEKVDLISCPFCGEKDFDLIGLKGHIWRGWCEAYEETPLSDHEVHP